MAIEHGKIVPLNSDFSKHNEAYYIKHYSKIIINSIPELESFVIHNIPERLNFNEQDKARFKNDVVLSGIKKLLLDGYATHIGSNYTLSFGAKNRMIINAENSAPAANESRIKALTSYPLQYWLMGLFMAVIAGLVMFIIEKCCK